MIASHARSRILSDHAVLRELLRRVASHARAASEEETHRPRVRDALAELRAKLEAHLSFEEAVLVPLLETADAWGQVRVADMAKDHAGQRALLVALTEDAGDGARSMTALAEELVWFVECLERDIRDEEEKLLSSTALGEETVVVDQTDG
jgi:iron-sulfur cluster repair protein YtfE (RIC family)